MSEEMMMMDKLPCQNCGELVEVCLPFYGCVFCSECKRGESYETADAPEFKKKIEWPTRKENNAEKTKR